MLRREAVPAPYVLILTILRWLQVKTILFVVSLLVLCTLSKHIVRMGILSMKRTLMCGMVGGIVVFVEENERE